MIERQLDIATRDGSMSTFVCHPERGGPYAPILFFMDAPGIREELRDMVRRIASVGYFVLLPNMYYRAGVMELGPLSRDPNAPERKRMMELMASLDIPKVMSDTEAMFAFLDGEKAARKGPIGAVGYCMSGQYAISAAANFPGRVAAAASIYGVQLVTEKPDSPHKVAKKARAELYFACAGTDHWMPLELIPQLKAQLEADKVDAEVEIYAKTEHGFAFPQRPAYDKPAAERHWERLFAMWRRKL